MVNEVHVSFVVNLLRQTDLAEEALLQRFIIFEHTPQAARHQARFALLDPAHHTAQVLPAGDDCHSLRSNCLHDAFSDLAGHAFLELQAVSENIHQAGNLRQAYHFSIWDVSISLLSTSYRAPLSTLLTSIP